MFCKLLQSDEDDLCKDFANDAEKGDASVVVAVVPLFLVLEECDDFGVPHVLWYSSFLPALTEDYIQRASPLIVGDGSKGTAGPLQSGTSDVAGVARMRLSTTTNCLRDSNSGLFLEVYS